MERCLQLAMLGAGNVAPNPMVGAVLVYENRVIGEGYHQQYGQPHAEVNCINSVKEEDRALIQKSTLYVSLEPCAHYGKTPPCADRIIENKIPEVVIGCKDDYLEVNGKGIEKLQANGVRVITGVLEKECIALNKRFFTFHQQKRPYIILKWAQSNNEKISGADDKRIFISNAMSNRLVHKWRSEEAAILVGSNTALKDDPALTTRLWPGNNPVRLVIDNALQLPSTLKLFDRSVRTIVFNTVKQQENDGLLYYKIEKANSINEILGALYQLRLQSIIVEGGAKLLQSFIDAGLWDEARIITNTILQIEKGIDAPILNEAVLQKKDQLLDDSIGYYTHGR
jgi:diaminohydroxyphosphoribosylaminopyrimidine deaminase / 5-amino-6-(5-phosphoribosylamino)uracil reductase